VVNSVLAEVVRCLEASLWILKFGQGGRKRAIDRHAVIFMLVEAWDRMGKRISTGPKSEFVQFVETIVVSIHWSEIGISDAVADAVKDWRNRRRKTCQ